MAPDIKCTMLEIFLCLNPLTRLPDRGGDAVGGDPVGGGLGDPVGVGLGDPVGVGLGAAGGGGVGNGGRLPQLGGVTQQDRQRKIAAFSFAQHFQI